MNQKNNEKVIVQKDVKAQQEKSKKNGSSYVDNTVKNIAVGGFIGTGIGAAAGYGAACLLASNPIGWCVLGAGAVFGLAGGVSRSKDKNCIIF